MRTWPVALIVLILSAGVASPDTWTELLLNPGYCSSIGLSCEITWIVGINDDGWVAGNYFNYYEQYAALWIPNGQSSVESVFIQDPWAMTGHYAVDIHDNGDVLIFGTMPEAGSGLQACSDPPCIEGVGFMVFHAGGAPRFSSKNYTCGDYEWLSDESVWSTSGSGRSNSAGRYIETIGNHTYLVTPDMPIPEPSTIALLLTAAGGVGLAAWRRAAAS